MSFPVFCHECLLRRWRESRTGAKHHVWLSGCALPWPTGLMMMFSFSSLSLTVGNGHLSVCLSVDGPPLFLYCRACPPPQHLLNRLFGCFYMAVFYHFCCFNLMWFLFHCTPCLYSSLPSVCEGQRWPVKATVCLLRRGGAFISVLCFLPAPLVHTHTHIHTQQYHTASSYVFMLVFCKQ